MKQWLSASLAVVAGIFAPLEAVGVQTDEALGWLVRVIGRTSPKDEAAEGE